MDLFQYLENCDIRLFDNTVYEHIRAVCGSLVVIRRDGRRGTHAIDDLSAWVQKNAPFYRPSGELGSRDGQRLGSLKKLGRKPTFGFVVDSDQNEFFIAAVTIDPEIWQWLNEDGLVLFEERTSGKGPLAINIVRYEADAA